MSRAKVKSLNQLLAKIVLALLVLYVFYLVSQLMQPGQSSADQYLDNNAQALKANHQMPIFDVSFGLFGSVEKHNNYKTVRKAKLDLNLIGTLNSGSKSLAIIKDRRGEAKIYAIGDLVAPSAYLEDVQEKMMIIRRGNELEKISINFKKADLSPKVLTLNLKSEKTRAPRAPTQKSIQSKLSIKQKKRIQSYLLQLKNDTNALSSLVIIKDSPGQRGIAIYPGREKDLFFKFGFKPGDMVLGIDQVSIDDSKQWKTISSLLLKQQRFNVIINRHGEIKNLLINIE